MTYVSLSLFQLSKGGLIYENSYKNKLASHLAVVAVCDAEPAAWQDLKAFKDAFAGFKGCVTLIQELSPLVGRLPTGLTLDKQRVREQLAEAVMEVASAARAHASKVQDGELAVKVNVSRTRLLNCRATESADLSQSVVEAIKPKAAQMADVGVSAQDLTIIEGLLDVYREKITQPREIRIQGKTARKQLEAEFAMAT
jgi:methionine synthase II (cobalamin-independent)